MADQESYIFGKELALDVARLQSQDAALNEAYGLLPAGLALSELHDILDLACGTGIWICEVVRLVLDQNPGQRIAGMAVDKNEPMLRYASAHSMATNMQEYLSFQQGDLLAGKLPFPDQSFDLVHGRLIAAFMPWASWPAYLQECLRVLRPGGYLIQTETEFAFANSEAWAHIIRAFLAALKNTGKLPPAPFNDVWGMTISLPKLIRQAGFRDVQLTSHVVESSHGIEPLHTIFAEDFSYGVLAARSLLEPYLADFDETYQQLMRDMHDPHYTAGSFSLTVTARKPILSRVTQEHI